MKKFSSTMKASSRRASHNKRLTRLALISGTVVLAAALIPSVLGFFAVLLSPVISMQNYFAQSIDTIPSYFRDRNQLLQEQHDLERALADQSGSDLTVSKLLEENNALRSLLGATSTARIGASVIKRPTALPYDVFVIDKGLGSGVRQYAPVYSGRDQVIGFVAQVERNTSVVVLITTPGLTSTVYIYGPDIYTTAVGMGAGSLRVNVPQGILLEEGNLVVVPSFESGVYGKIISVDSVPTRPEQYGFVSIETPMTSIQFVSVGMVPFETQSFEAAQKVVEGLRKDILEIPVPADVLIDAGISSTTATSTGVSDPTL